MSESINRIEGTNVDWSHMSGKNKQSLIEGESKSLSNKRQTDQDYAFSTSKEIKERLYKELEKNDVQFQALNQSLRMKYNEEAQQFYVEVVDIASKEVLETIPAEHVIELAAKLKAMVGFFIDEKR